jgi:PAS domain S-box-containing protein
MSTPIRILILEDQSADAELMVHELRRAGFEPVWQRVETESDYLAHLDPALDLILADYRLPQFDGLRALQLLPASGLDIPLILVSGALGDETAVEAIKQGAADYVLKDRLARLGPAVVQTLARHRLSQENRRAAEALRESEERYRGLFERVPVGLYRTTPTGEIVDANPALVQLLGYPDRESLLQCNVHRIYVDPEARQQQMELVQRVRVVHGFEMQLHRADGTVIWVRDTLRTVTGDDGQVQYIEGAMEDITERTRAEEERQKLEAQLRQSQKMEAVGLLAGGVAHDFNNRLTVIQGNAQLALAQMGPSDPRREYLTSVEQAAQAAAVLTRQLLAFGLRQTLQPRSLDLNQLILAIAKMLQRMVGEAIELQFDPAPGVVEVCADPNALEQVLMNLVVNARDAMPDGGTLRIATARVQVDQACCEVHPEAKVGDYIRLTVADSGVGMDETVKERLFEPFFTTKAPDKGSGLGLATVYGIARQHDGWIEVESAPGEGATFHIYLPVAQQAAQEVPQREQTAAMPVGEKTILLAEDEELVRDVVRRMLEQLGHHVLVAADGEQAVELFTADPKRVDLVILDAVMPKLSGTMTCASIRALRTDVPVLFMTGHSQDVAHLPPGSERVQVLAKPFGLQGLAQKIGDVLDEAATTSTAAGGHG